MKRTLVNWSNVFFLIPLAFAWKYSVSAHLILLPVLLIFSLIYHGSGERRFSITDSFLAHLLILTNFVFWFKGGFNDVYSLLVPFGIAAALFFYYTQTEKNYPINHSLWHFFSVVITSLCILTFVY